MYKYISILILFIAFTSCTKKEKLDIDVSDILVDVDVHRFDQEFYTANSEKLPVLKSKYPYLFPAQNHDSIWLQKIQNKDEQELYAETQKVFSDFSDEKEQLENLFKHIKFYYPEFNSPKVVTLLSNVDYETKVVYADSLLLISLDIYLGKDSKIYESFPNYIKQNFTKDHLIVDVANAITNVQIPFSTDRTFVSRMVQQGKKMYLLDAYLPKVSDANKMGYTEEQIEWAEFNDEEVWKYFVQNKLLFSTEQELSRRFIDNAPFSKFYQANDNETPGRIGVWFGWQIVRAYMQNTNTSLQEMLKTKNEEIFKKSKYKPVR
ncbi:gliding motility lipoprotein GldB [Aureibaculum sp. 2210JD6-5]|uniref:gliding motility lipoprotein GldB n=1 Tax=Aureibaculum sp. 2210JD6-5 TaxID=3103957 RepID=UPI002AAEA6DD|nr:gliding motility lipoprotein GldB [Aureibaculum sp. 2210JD6-5]MDY7396269.1 gliding motility lipoprotein GldB [Aureibaculum sp. 2210JD6-5]